MVRCVVSLTTSPDRLHRCEKTIDSLLNQYHQPEAIYLHLPQKFGRTGKEYTIPEWLEQKVKDHPILHIHRTEEDYGSITKLVPTLELVGEDEDVWIATADDDIEYLPHQLQMYCYFTEVFAVKSALGLSGFNLVNWALSKTAPRGKLGCNPCKKTEACDIIEGYGMAFYHRSHFQTSFIAYMKKCIEQDFLKKSDDVVISNWLALNKVQRVQVGVPYCSRARLWGEKRILDYGNDKDALHLMDDNAEKYELCLKWLEKRSICGFAREHKEKAV